MSQFSKHCVKEYVGVGVREKEEERESSQPFTVNTTMILRYTDEVMKE